MTDTCQWCGGDRTLPGHDQTRRHRFWLTIAQFFWLS
jgi:hypothetical protein